MTDDLTSESVGEILAQAESYQGRAAWPVWLVELLARALLVAWGERDEAQRKLDVVRARVDALHALLREASRANTFPDLGGSDDQ